MKEVYSPAEIARICHVTKPTVHKWIQLGKLKGISLPHGFKKIPAGELKRFLDEVGIAFPQSLPPKGSITRVLLVDDEPPVLNLLKDLIQTFTPDGAVEVATCANGLEACLKIGTWIPDLVILDIQMPGMNGFEVTAKIRENPDLDGVRLLILTGFFEEEMMGNVDRYRLEDILSKPISIDIFKQKILPILRDKKLR